MDNKSDLYPLMLKNIARKGCEYSCCGCISHWGGECEIVNVAINEGLRVDKSESTRIRTMLSARFLLDLTVRKLIESDTQE